MPSVPRCHCSASACVTERDASILRVVYRAGRKSCAVTTAQRLGQFLGDERIQDKGLNCKYVIARRPEVPHQPTEEWLHDCALTA